MTFEEAARNLMAHAAAMRAAQERHRQMLFALQKTGNGVGWDSFRRGQGCADSEP